MTPTAYVHPDLRPGGRGGRCALGRFPPPSGTSARRSPFERGLNVKKVQRWLGHHSPSFTLDTYVHLLDEGLPEPVRLEEELLGADATPPARRDGQVGTLSRGDEVPE